MFTSLIGKRTIGIGYGLAACELVLAPFTPSNTARGGGIVHPDHEVDRQYLRLGPGQGHRGQGRHLPGTGQLSLQSDHLGDVLTATAPNPLVVDYIAKATNQSLHLSWTSWALCMCLPGLLCMLVMPLVIYVLSPPQLKATPNAVEYARAEMAKMGPVSPKEMVMMGTFALLLLLWANVPATVFGPSLTLDPTVVAFVGLFVLIITGTIDWDDVLSEKSAWDTLVWFGALIMLAEQLNKQGVIAWFAAGMKGAIVASGIGWGGAAAILLLVFVFSHYLFASTTAHISAMMLAFLTVGVLLIPPEYVVPFMLMMAAGSAIMMTLTHYATGTSPIIFGSGFVTMGTWWRVGFVMCLVELLIFAVVGSIGGRCSASGEAASGPAAPCRLRPANGLEQFEGDDRQLCLGRFDALLAALGESSWRW
jgi:DASS family divalent anion:Na+ symporter